MSPTRVTLALVLASTILAGNAHSATPPETRAALSGLVTTHVRNLLHDRFDAAWTRIHALDRRTVGRRLWEDCKRAPEGSLGAVEYRGVRVVRSRTTIFRSSLHDRVRAVAVTVEVHAVFSGVPMQIRDVSHWMLASGRWARLVEARKLRAYAAGRCPS